MTKAEARRIANSIASDVLRREAGAGVVAIEAERSGLSDKDHQLLEQAVSELIDKLAKAGERQSA